VKHEYDLINIRRQKQRLRKLIIPSDSTGILQQHMEHHPRHQTFQEITELIQPFVLDNLKVYNTFASE
jgi:hypothetical protein